LTDNTKREVNEQYKKNACDKKHKKRYKNKKKKDEKTAVNVIKCNFYFFDVLLTPCLFSSNKTRNKKKR